MSEIIACIFNAYHGAEQFADQLAARDPAGRDWIKDAAFVARDETGDLTAVHLTDLVGHGSLGGIFWGFLFSLIFWSKWWDLTIPLSFHDEFVKQTGEALGKGHLGLFVYTDDPASAVQSTDQAGAELIRAELGEDDKALLHRLFQVK